MDAARLCAALDAHIDLLLADLEKHEQRGLRTGERMGSGPWVDRTEQTIHDKRNLVAALSSIKMRLLKDLG